MNSAKIHFKIFFKRHHLSFYYRKYDIICFRFYQGNKTIKNISFTSGLYLKRSFLSLNKTNAKYKF